MRRGRHHRTSTPHHRIRRAGLTLLACALLLGSLTALTGSGPAGATTARIVYTYEVRGLGNQSSLSTFATQAAETYADGRGWNLGGSIAFRRVASGGNFTLWLSAAGNLPGFGSPCDSAYSCQSGRNVIINETRWLSATSTWLANHRSLRDYRHMVINHETGHWLGFGHAFCGGAGQLAPLMQQQSISLQGCRPNPWPLRSERERLATSRGVPIISGSPIGSFDSVAPALAGVRVRGWVIDPNTTAPGRVHVYVDSHGYSAPADKLRADVARVYPAFGSRHGFAVRVPASPGTHRVCVYAPNTAGPGSTTLLGCKAVTVSGSPGGRFESAAAAPSAVRAVGWVIDPDTVAAVRTHVYVDGHGVATTADRDRPDVGAAYPKYGSAHGFSVLVPTAPGQHQVCAFALNAAGTGSTVSLGCRTVLVAS